LRTLHDTFDKDNTKTETMLSINFAKIKGNNTRQDTHKPTFETLTMKQHAT
jgi:hypothetical protein